MTHEKGEAKPNILNCERNHCGYLGQRFEREIVKQSGLDKGGNIKLEGSLFEFCSIKEEEDVLLKEDIKTEVEAWDDGQVYGSQVDNFGNDLEEKFTFSVLTNDFTRSEVKGCGICNTEGQAYSCENSLEVDRTEKVKTASDHVSDILWEKDADQFAVKTSTCDVCSEVLERENILQHIKDVHEISFLYRCSTCSFVAKDLSEVETHEEVATTHEVFRTFTCVLCKYEFDSLLELDEHFQLSHQKPTNHQCTLCSSNFKSYLFPTLLEHNDNVHQKREMSEMNKRALFNFYGGRNLHECESCDFKHVNKLMLFKHLQHWHPDMKLFKCDRCNYGTNWERHMKRHKATVHNAFDSTDVKLFCKKCGLNFMSITALQSHIKETHSKQNHSLLRSIKRNSLDNSKQNDLRQVRRRSYKKLKCGKCDKWFGGNSALARHRRTHLALTYSCAHCDFRSRFKGGLRTHILCVHFRMRNYKCIHCVYECSSKTLLKNHMQSKHLNENFSCKVCNKSYTCEKALRSHFKKVHSSDPGKSYSCHFCSYSTKWPSALKSHLNALHYKAKSYSCDACDYKTYIKGNLRLHVRNLHEK